MVFHEVRYPQVKECSRDGGLICKVDFSTRTCPNRQLGYGCSSFLTLPFPINNLYVSAACHFLPARSRSELASLQKSRITAHSYQEFIALSPIYSHTKIFSNVVRLQYNQKPAYGAVSQRLRLIKMCSFEYSLPRSGLVIFMRGNR